MRRTRIKICGISTPETALAAADAGADAVGLVFVAQSPRRVTPDQARQIIRVLPAFVESIALFVNTPAEQILAITTELNIRTVQLHGQESPADVRVLAPLRVIKALPFTRDIAALAAPWADSCDNLIAMILDTPPAPDTTASLTGGAGQSFNWHDLASRQQAGLFAALPPLILAGGLTAQNVPDAIRTVKPYAVDVSSGVESSRGVKDVQRIRAFCDVVQQTDRNTY